MIRHRDQITAGIDSVPCVDINLVPITYGCTLRASVAGYKGRWGFRDITVAVEDWWLPYCVLRCDEGTIPFYYDADRGLMIGGRVSMTWPVWCEVLPATSPFYR